MQVIPRTELGYLLSSDLVPVATVTNQESFAVDTEDAFSGKFRHLSDLESFINFLSNPADAYFRANPVVGPIYISDAEPEDVLAVTVEGIKLDSQGGTCFQLGEGSFPHWFDRPLAKIVNIEKGNINWDENIRIPIQPLVGLIGVAPPYESLSSTKAGQYGGNMDCRFVTVGNTLLLPVYHPGALLFVGDVHAIQGDGEFSWVAVETRARVTVQVEVIKGNFGDFRWPRVYTENEIVTIVSARPIDNAIASAFREMILCLEEEYNFDRGEAYMLLGQVADARICNMFTACCVFPKRYLPKEPPWPKRS
jgi:amidase